MFRIKICGITRPEDARVAAEEGADAIGLNFYEKSKRYIDPRRCCELDWSGIELKKVGVFVNMDPTDVASTANLTGLNAVQLHGDEPASWLAKMPPLALVRARRMDKGGSSALSADLQACREAGRSPDALLVDAYTPGHFGGTGETVPWAGLADYRKWLGDIPLILAGGLTPDNVAEAIRIVQPHGVDVASGVEESPGVKCPEKVRFFVSRAKAAFAELG